MPWVGSEPTIPASQREKTVHASDGAATVIGTAVNMAAEFCKCHNPKTAALSANVQLTIFFFAQLSLLRCELWHVATTELRYTTRVITPANNTFRPLCSHRPIMSVEYRVPCISCFVCSHTLENALYSWTSFYEKLTKWWNWNNRIPLLRITKNLQLMMICREI
jgi:hypothetical protein